MDQNERHNTPQSGSTQGKRFVVLCHQFPEEHEQENHWDLMLEHEGRLLTWRLGELPRIDKVIVAEQIADHRIAYLEYQGEVSNNRGWVKRVASGTYSTDRSDPQFKTLIFANADPMRVRFSDTTIEFLAAS